MKEKTITYRVKVKTKLTNKQIATVIKFFIDDMREIGKVITITPIQ